MANKFYEENDISAIASAIRTKLGTQDTFKVSEMASAIASITPYAKTPLEADYNIGYVTYVSSNQTGTWTYNNDGTRRSDIYEVEQGKQYRLSYGTIPGSRFRAIVTETDVRTLPSGSSLTECQFVGSNQTPEAYASRTFTASVTGYLVLYKTSDNIDGIKTYLLDYAEM